MLFEKRFWPLIADGSVTMTFRRWRRPQVKAGRPNRTPGGIVHVTTVDIVEPGDITDEEARRSGYPSAAALVADLRGDDAVPVYRIAFELATGPDPRGQLAENDDLDADAIRTIDQRLDRLDRASSIGPWTRAALEVIHEHPAVPAGELAAKIGRERAPFKLDVRKLKNLGLTISLERGYKLSPRGDAYVRVSRSTRGTPR